MTTTSAYPPAAPGRPERRPLLQATGMSKRFAGIAALEGVSIHVGRGELVALIGPNGAGKSTLFNCLSGVIAPDQGTVTFDGQEIGSLAPYQRARLGLSRTFQQVELFPGLTVLGHLLVALRAQHQHGTIWRDLLGRSRPRAEETRRCLDVLGHVGLADQADEPIERLSLGQDRLVELARALVTGPRLLFLDEPSSGLDVRETEEMAAVLEHVRHERDVAVLLCEHDVPFVERLASRTVVLDCGRVIAEGPTADVLARPEVRVAYLGASA
jgi:branched-chain amino acid transport system ATP-binding protein